MDKEEEEEEGIVMKMKKVVMSVMKTMLLWLWAGCISQRPLLSVQPQKGDYHPNQYIDEKDGSKEYCPCCFSKLDQNKF